MRMLIVLILSCVIFFGIFVASLIKFGVLNCYSAYGARWDGITQLNLWSASVIISALLLVPVLLELGDNNPYQFAGFLAPVSLVLVGITPHYTEDKMQWWMHQIGAWGAVIWVALYVIMIKTAIIPLIVFLAIATGMTIKNKNNWMLYYETAMYAAIYMILFIMLI